VLFDYNDLTAIVYADKARASQSSGFALTLSFLRLDIGGRVFFDDADLRLRLNRRLTCSRFQFRGNPSEFPTDLPVFSFLLLGYTLVVAFSSVMLTSLGSTSD